MDLRSGIASSGPPLPHGGPEARRNPAGFHQGGREEAGLRQRALGPAGAEPGPPLTKMAGAVTPEGAEQLVAVVTEGECRMLMRQAGSWAAQGLQEGVGVIPHRRRDRGWAPIAPGAWTGSPWVGLWAWVQGLYKRILVVPRERAGDRAGNMGTLLMLGSLPVVCVKPSSSQELSRGCLEQLWSPATASLRPQGAAATGAVRAYP